MAIRSEASLAGLSSAGLVKTASSKKTHIAKHIYQLRRQNKQFQLFSIATSQRLYGNGHLLSGRYVFNVGKKLRYGHYARVLLWVYCTGFSQKTNQHYLFPRITRMERLTAPYKMAERNQFYPTGGFFSAVNSNRLSITPKHYKTISYVSLLSTTSLKTVWYQTNIYLNRFRTASCAFDQRKAGHTLQTSIVDKLHTFIKMTNILFKKKFSIFGTKGD